MSGIDNPDAAGVDLTGLPPEQAITLDETQGGIMTDVDTEALERLVRSLRDDLDATAARLAEVEAERDAALTAMEHAIEERDRIERVAAEKTAAEFERNNLAAENARLRQERDKYLARLEEYDGAAYEQMRARLDTAYRNADLLRQQRDEVRAERDAMRPVAKAAQAWFADVAGVAREHFHPLEWALRTAVDAYRAGQKAPATAPARLCRAEYERLEGRQRGDRVVRCGLPAGHDGDHDEMIDGEPGNSWPREDIVHVYLSTACHHDHHGHCSAPIRQDGTAKQPARCKWCPSPCVCPCHAETADHTTSVGAFITSVSADPPGVHAAIEAGARALFGLGRTPGIDWWAGSITDNTRRVYRDKAEAVARAAAPALRAGALREAADEFEAPTSPTIRPGVWTSRPGCASGPTGR